MAGSDSSQSPSRADTASEAPSRAPSQAPSQSESLLSTKRRSRGTRGTGSKHSSAGGGFFIVCLAEGRSQGEIGLCAVDMRTSSCYLTQLQDSATYAKVLYKLFQYDPVEIIVSATTVEPTKSKLVRLVVDQFDVEVVPIARRAFNADAGLQYIQQYGLQDDIQDLVLGMKSKHVSYFCLAACSALLQYVEAAQGVKFVEHSIQFKWAVHDSVLTWRTLMIDQVTARSLELVTNLLDPQSRHTLLGTLDKTQTPMGRRLLRMTILQPAALKSFLDLDHLITAIIQVPTKPSIKHAEQSINCVIGLRHALTALEVVRVAISGCRNELAKAVFKVLSDPRLKDIEVQIEQVINEDITFQKSPLGLRNQRCYGVKAGFNGLLDVARQTYKETTNDVYELVNTYAEQYQLPLKPNFSPATGFQITCPRDLVAQNDLPLTFINVVMRKKQAYFTTLDLVGSVLTRYHRINESLAEIYLMSDRIVSELLADIRTRVAVLYKASDSVALLDMLAAFAGYCVVSKCVRPEFTQAVKNGRHPIKEKVLVDPMVPNDCYASAANNFQIITGPNTSGKSTYLKMIALLQVMSQIGCYVPAEYGSFRVADAIFSKTCNDDDLEQLQSSTYLTEMVEIAHILRSATDTSLVIIDELGRATSTNDGLGISFAISEELLRSKSFVFFATHFIQLAHLLDSYPNVVNLHLSVALDDRPANKRPPGYKYLYTVKDGSTIEQHYGQ
ncbi:muts domain V-domain-containing protein [Hyaloraphidium curvatum]|nr:muts domain V-domain-containing protein [Hyaloraphidium curvatum]